MSQPTVNPDDHAEVEPGEGFTETTDAPDWILLSASAPAVKLYLVMRMRLNHKRRDRKVWPGRASLAVMLDVKQPDTVSGYLKELAAIGAITITRTKTVPSYNVYRINHAPPRTFKGFRAMEDWDREPSNIARAAVIRDAEKAKRDKARAKQKAVRGARSAMKAQVVPDTGSTKCLPPEAPKPALPDTGSNRSLDTGSNHNLETGLSDDLETGLNGPKPLGVSQGVPVTVSATSASKDASAETSAAGEPQQQEQTSSPEPENKEGYAPDGYPLVLTDWESALVAELSRLRPDWGPRSVRIAVGCRSVRARTELDPALVRRAFLLGAEDRAVVGVRKGTYSPMRLADDRCPLWGQAAAPMPAAGAEAAADALAVATSGDAEGRAPVTRQRSAEAKPSPGQESPATGEPLGTPAEERARARTLIAAARERNQAAGSRVVAVGAGAR